MQWKEIASRNHCNRLIALSDLELLCNGGGWPNGSPGTFTFYHKGFGVPPRFPSRLVLNFSLPYLVHNIKPPSGVFQYEGSSSG